MRPLWLVVGLAGCAWIDDGSGRLDHDDDDIHVREDCNDRNAEFSYLQPFHGSLTCGDQIEGDHHDGFDAMQTVNCLHPFEDTELISAGYKETIYGFRADQSTDVLVALDADDMLVESLQSDHGEVGLLAFRGPECQLDACDVGMPLMPSGWHKNDRPIPLEEREGGWRSQLYFHAQPGERWFIVVTGGSREDEDSASPFTLAVVCP